MSDILKQAEKRHARLYALADALREGDVVDMDVELTRQPNSPERTLKLDVDVIRAPPDHDIGPVGLPGIDLHATDADGQGWRVRFVKPGVTPNGSRHRGTANIYRGDSWAMNTGVVQAMDPHDREDGTFIGGYADHPLDESRCPECGNETGNVHAHPVGDIQPIPDEQAARCGSEDCDHHDHALAFIHAYQWERMSEDEREEQRQKAEAHAARAAEAEYSAGALFDRREP